MKNLDASKYVKFGESGAFTVTGDASSDYQYNTTDKTLTILTSNALTIANKDKSTPTTAIIVVSTGVTANITLDGVNISVDSGCAFELQGVAKMNLTLLGTNTLTSGGSQAGLLVPKDAKLTIGGTGSLNAAGGHNSAGISAVARAAKAALSPSVVARSRQLAEQRQQASAVDTAVPVEASQLLVA